MLASAARGGGGVFVASCEYSEVSRLARRRHTEDYTYPSSAVLADQKHSTFFNGRTIQLVYEPIAA